MLSVDQATDQIQATIRRQPSETVALKDSLGRVVAEPVFASRTLPPFDNSAMDGFAARCADLPGTLAIAGVVAAGDRPGAELPSGAVLRIMTGAPVPVGADVVVMRENVQDHGQTAEFAEKPEQGRHIRRAGTDVAPGDEVLGSGETIEPGEIGMLAAIGHAEVAVARKPRVAIISTGDELIDVDQTPAPGQIVNSNAYALAAQVLQAGGVPVPLGIARDDREELKHLLRQGLSCDMVLTSGGVSVGDYDHVKEVLSQVGVDVVFWKVAMKPGKPLVFGTSRESTPVFGLPGNPVSSMVSFELFARPAIRAMLGARETQRPQVPVVLDRDYDKAPGRQHYVRARIFRRDSQLVADTLAKQSSGMLSSMVAVDGLIIIPAATSGCRKGEIVKALLFKAI